LLAFENRVCWVMGRLKGFAQELRLKVMELVRQARFLRWGGSTWSARVRLKIERH
jgi:hypothetical protein